MKDWRNKTDWFDVAICVCLVLVMTAYIFKLGIFA